MVYNINIVTIFIDSMDANIFYNAGKITYRFKLEIIAFWIIALLICLPHLTDIISPFTSTGFIATNSRSDIADKYLAKNLKEGNNQFLVIYHSKNLQATSPTFQNKIDNSLKALKDFPIEHEVILPKNNPEQISKDKHTAYVAIIFKTNETLKAETINKFQDSISKPKEMSVYLGGEPIFIQHINEQTQKDLFKADMIAAPISIITLLIVFKTVVAALIPIYLGASSALLILSILYFLGHFFGLSIFTINIALLLGLCLSLDYALFIVYRFREELDEAKDPQLAIAKTMATAGKAVFYSGIAVFISLSALLIFPINIMFSIGVGGLVAVFVAVSAALTLLPALLSVLKHRVNSLAIRRIKNQSTDLKLANDNSMWHKLATAVTKKPGLYSLLILAFISVLSYTVQNIKIGISDYNVLPDHSQNQDFFDIYKSNFNTEGLTPIKLIISPKQGKVTTNENIQNIYYLIHKIQKHANVKTVNSIVSISPDISLRQYQYIYANTKQMDKNLKILLQRSTRNNFTVATIISKYSPNTTQTRDLIKYLESLKSKNLNLQLTGIPVNNADVLHAIVNNLPHAIIWIVTLTYLILLILLRSMILPLQAIFMNVLSLCASYGVLVFIFQEGYLHEFLQFKPQGMTDVSLIIIIFCALFGFSMDYEVFLLTRIHEAYITTRNNTQSIIFGIVKSSRIITSAALIVILLCGSFMFADVLMVKEFGLGIAVAIFVDAFAIRTILVPATMTLLNKWNWYLPNFLKNLKNPL